MKPSINYQKSDMFWQINLASFTKWPCISDWVAGDWFVCRSSAFPCHLLPFFFRGGGGFCFCSVCQESYFLISVFPGKWPKHFHFKAAVETLKSVDVCICALVWSVLSLQCLDLYVWGCWTPRRGQLLKICLSSVSVTLLPRKQSCDILISLTKNHKWN